MQEVELKDVFLFAGVPEALELAEGAEIVSYRRGETIYDPSACRRSLGVLLSGRAEATSAARAGAVLSSFGPGGVFGAAALFGMEQPYVSCIRAVTECRVQFLPEELLQQIFMNYPAAAVNYIAFLSSRIRFLNGKIAVLAQNDTEGRLYRYLTEYCEGQPPRRINMTNLAAALNMGRTSLYRALDSLEKKKLITRKNGNMEVLR